MTKRIKIFSDIFPPPDYLAMPAVCVDLSDRSVKYMEMTRKKGEVRLKNFDVLPVPDGLIHNGEIKEKGKLTDFLKKLKKIVRNDFVAASLPEEKVFLSRIELPEMSYDKIKGALSLQIEDYIPMAANDVVFDFDIVERSKDGKKLIMSVGAFPKEFVGDYRDVFAGAGFVPIAFEMETQAFVRAVVPREEKGCVMVIDFGRTRTTFVIVDKGNIVFATTVSVAGDEIDNSIMRELSVGKEETKKIKREKGLLKGKSDTLVFNSILPTAAVIKDEAKKNIDYWSSKKKDGFGEVSQIILCGGESSLAGLPEYLSYGLNIGVRVADPWVNAGLSGNWVPEIEKVDSLAYSTVIGLAIGRIFN